MARAHPLGYIFVVHPHKSIYFFLHLHFRDRTVHSSDLKLPEEKKRK